MGEEKRHEMMETLFGAESEDSDDEPEQSLRPALSDQASDRSVGALGPPLSLSQALGRHSPSARTGASFSFGCYANFPFS